MAELATARVLVAGAGGVVGRALMRRLDGAVRLLRGWRTTDGDLRREAVAQAALAENDYDIVFVLAATQGGIADNIARPREFLEDNALIALNIIKAAADRGAPRLIFTGSTVLYSMDSAQPHREEQVGQGTLDQTHQGYALAKLMGLRLCAYYAAERDLQYSTAVLGNVFGPGASFDAARATVAPSLIRNAVEARRAGAATLKVWGTGRATRDLLAADDAAEALALIAERQTGTEPINVASGIDRPIREIGEAAAAAAGFTGALEFDASKPEGVLSRSIDISRLQALGFSPRVDLLAAFRELAEFYERG